MHPGKATSDLRTRNFRVQRLGERHACSRKLRSRQEWTTDSVHSLCLNSIHCLPAGCMKIWTTGLIVPGSSLGLWKQRLDATGKKLESISWNVFWSEQWLQILSARCTSLPWDFGRSGHYCQESLLVPEWSERSGEGRSAWTFLGLVVSCCCNQSIHVAARRRPPALKAWVKAKVGPWTVSLATSLKEETCLERSWKMVIPSVFRFMLVICCGSWIKWCDYVFLWWCGQYSPVCANVVSKKYTVRTSRNKKLHHWQ